MRSQLSVAVAMSILSTLVTAAPVSNMRSEEVSPVQNTVYRREPVTDDAVDPFINVLYKPRDSSEEVSPVQNTVYRREPVTDDAVDPFINVLYKARDSSEEVSPVQNTVYRRDVDTSSGDVSPVLNTVY